ncbi:MAG: hypothetical protein FJ098_17295, partial [Deltaproteobacteria bacterium]|nr:hypothetical protein [Deltaproteobacteria bacterium]
MNVRIVVLLFSLLTVAGMARGADPSRLTTDGAEKAALVLSPDGTRAVFLLHRTTGSGYDICVLDLAVGGPARNLTASLAEGLPLESSRQFAVSLDGLAVLYVHDYEIWR